MKATAQSVEALHGLLTDHFRKMLESGEDLKAADLNAIRAFLSDNGIQAPASNNPKQPFNQLVGTALPFLDPDMHD